MGRRRRGSGDREDADAGRECAAGSAILRASIASLHWRLTQSATRIGEAGDAMKRCMPEQAMERLFEIEPLLFEAGRILSAVFILAREGDECRAADEGAEGSGSRRNG